MNHRLGRRISQEKTAVLGQLIDLSLALSHMSRKELAQQAGLAESTITRLCQEKRTVKRATLLHLCAIMQTPPWLETAILNAADYATEEQRTRARSRETIEALAHRVSQELRQS